MSRVTRGSRVPVVLVHEAGDLLGEDKAQKVVADEGHDGRVVLGLLEPPQLADDRGQLRSGEGRGGRGGEDEGEEGQDGTPFCHRGFASIRV